MKELQLKQEKLVVERAPESRLAEESKMKYGLELKRMEADRSKSKAECKRDELMTTVMMEALKGLNED
ncbi:hypothetical protein RvY_08954 [Ramazzottius varieornatus]|uniref:Uncharacterized protein n=1 Tax=Ramazzottius varieornatus TaxID=947166 RepID=A0A1D1V7S8_RAMVA|nr:hypothetical protein RvY_08954 [Ramazzottius varieornatus]